MLRLWNVCLVWFGNLRLKTKLYMSFGWMCLFTILLGVVSLVDIERIRMAGQPSAAQQIASHAQAVILAMLAFILLLSFVMAWRLVHLIGDPLVNACKVLDRISHRDLTVHAEVVSRDEVGQMCEALNRTVAHMHDVLALLQKHADTLHNAAEDLAERTSLSSENCKRQADLARDVLESTRIMADNENRIAQNSRQTAAAGRESSDVAEHGRTLMASASKTMDQVAASSRDIAEMTSRLDGRSREIGKFVTAIQEISEQTNLLALNASIEAARAGEHGRGFAVVAGEVRRLAEHTRSATEEISAMVRAIQQETAQTTAAIDGSKASIESGRLRTAEAHQSLTRIREHASDTQSLAESTATAAEHQFATSQEIAHHVEQVAELAAASLSCSSELQNTTHGLRASSQAFSDVVHQFRL